VRKRSKGVTAFATLCLGYGFSWIFWTVWLYKTYRKGWLHFESINSYTCLYAIFIMLALAIGIGLFMLKEWGRKMALGLGTCYLLYSWYEAIKDATYLHQGKMAVSDFFIVIPISLAIIGVPIFLLWWFFTRPKVKEQFRQEE